MIEPRQKVSQRGRGAVYQVCVWGYGEIAAARITRSGVVDMDRLLSSGTASLGQVASRALPRSRGKQSWCSFTFARRVRWTGWLSVWHRFLVILDTDKICILPKGRFSWFYSLALEVFLPCVIAVA